MKRVFVAEHPFEAQLVRDLLESAGIEAVVRGEHLFALRGGLPLSEDTLPSVWLVYEEDFEPACTLLERQQARSRMRSIPGLARLEESGGASKGGSRPDTHDEPGKSQR